MASPTQWTCVWVSSGNWWWTGRPGMLQSMGSQRVGHKWMTELTMGNHLPNLSLALIFPRGLHWFLLDISDQSKTNFFVSFSQFCPLPSVLYLSQWHNLSSNSGPEPWHCPWSSLSHSIFSPLTTCTWNFQNTQYWIYSHHATHYNSRTFDWNFWISWSPLCLSSTSCFWQPAVYCLLKKRKNFSSDTDVCSGILCLLLPARLSSHSVHLFTLLILIFLLSPSSDVSLLSLSCSFPYRLTLSKNSSPVAPTKTDFLCSCFSCINSCFVLLW